MYFTERDIKQLTEDKRYGYVTYQDIRSVESFRQKTVLVVKAPSETELQVPQDHIDGEVCIIIQLHLIYIRLHIYFLFEPRFPFCSKRCT